MPPRPLGRPQMTPEQSPIARKLRTTAQNNTDAEVLCERRKVAHAAARWAFENGKGSRGVCVWIRSLRRPEGRDAQHRRAFIYCGKGPRLDVICVSSVSETRLEILVFPVFLVRYQTFT